MLKIGQKLKAKGSNMVWYVTTEAHTSRWDDKDKYYGISDRNIQGQIDIDQTEAWIREQFYIANSFIW